MAGHSLSPANAQGLVEIVPKNWHRYPTPISAANVKPEYVPVFTYEGGTYGDDVALAKSTVVVDERGVGPYTPRNQTEKAALQGNAADATKSFPGAAVVTDPDFTFATDITAPRGTIAPRTPYPVVGDAPAPAPVITTLAPSTIAAGSPSPLAVTITGTGFTQWSTVLTGGVQTPYSTYFSPTKIVLLMDPARSTAGIVQVIVRDHSVNSAPSNFTYT